MNSEPAMSGRVAPDPVTTPASRLQAAVEATALTLLVVPAIAIAAAMAAMIAKWWDPVIRARCPGLSLRAFLYGIGALLILIGRYW